MPLSDENKVLLYEALGIPSLGTGTIIDSLSHIPPSISAEWDTTYSTGDFTNVVTQVEARLTAATAYMLTRLATLLTEYSAIATSPMQLSQGGGGEVGRVIDHPTQRENIRQHIGDILGLAVPNGGFSAESKRLYGRGHSGDR